MLGALGSAIGGMMGGAKKAGGSVLSGGLMKPRGPMLHDTAPMTGPAQLSKPPKMGGARGVAKRMFGGNRKMTGGR